MNVAEYTKKLYARAGKEAVTPAHAQNNEPPATSIIGTSLSLYSLGERIRRMSLPDSSPPKDGPK